MGEEKKSLIFDKHNLTVLKKISEACEKSEKFIIIPKTFDLQRLIKMVNYFKLSIYYKRTHVTIFLTNFKGMKFTKIEDDRYRFLKVIFPKSKEYEILEKRRNKFFEDMMK